MKLILANEATSTKRRCYFHLVDATDGITPETGEAGGQPQVSSNGGAWTNTGISTLTAIGDGRYYADLTQTIVATAGTQIETRYKSANTAECPGDSFQVTAFDPYDVDSLGLTNLDATISTRASQTSLEARTLVAADYFDPANDTVAQVTLVDTTTDVTNQVSADVTAISGGATAADNLEATYDGTGYTDPVAPAQQQQLSAIANVGAAINVSADTAVITTGTETNTYTSTAALDGVQHTVTAVGGVIDYYYEFDVGPTGVPVTVSMTGRLYDPTPTSDTIEVSAYNWSTSSWDIIDTLDGSRKSKDLVYSFTLFTSMVGTGADAGTVRIRFEESGLGSGTAMRVDQIYTSYSVVTSPVGYANGTIWVDTVNGTAGSTKGVNGVADNPVDNWADALLISAATNLKAFTIMNGSSITLTATSDNYTFFGKEWTLNLGGQSIAGMYVEGSNISGTSTGTNYRFINSKIALSSSISTYSGGMKGCALGNAGITLLAAGTYLFDSCFSAVAGSGTPSLDVGSSVGDTNINIRHYSGGIELKNLGQSGTDKVSLEGWGQYILNANCVGGSMMVRGHFKETDNAGGAVTVTNDVNFDNIPTTSEFEARTLPSADYFDSTSDNVTVEDLTQAALAKFADTDTGETTTVSGSVAKLSQGSGATAPTVEEIRTEMDDNSTKLAAILTDTAEIGTAGAGLTNINLPDQTMNITGNLSGSVGSVTSQVSADITAISGDAVAADNLEADYDGTGYVKSNSVIGTTTTNTDMRGTDGANTVVPDVAGTAAGLHSTTDTLVTNRTILSADYFDPTSDNVTVEDLTQAALAKFVTTDTGESTAVTGSVAKISQGSAGGNVTVGDLTQAALAKFVNTDTGESSAVSGSVSKISQGNNFDAANDTVAHVTLVDTTTTNTDTASTLGTPVDLGDGATVKGMITAIAGKTSNAGSYDRTTDSVEAVRDRGDSAWTTGAGGSAPTVEEIRTEMDDNSTKLAAILADTAEIGTAGAGLTNINLPDQTMNITGNLSGSVGSVTSQVSADITAISGDTVAADNLEADYDGTGYVKSNSVIGTTTTNTDMRGTDGANTVVPDAAGTAAGLHSTTDTLINTRSSHTAAQAGEEAADHILVTPSQKITTDASGQVVTGDISTSALSKFITTDTGESTAATGSVAKISQGAAGGNVTVGDLTQAALAKFANTDTGETTSVAGSVSKLSQGSGSGSSTEISVEPIVKIEVDYDN